VTLTISYDRKLTEHEAREEADDDGELTIIIENVYLDDLIRGGHWEVVKDSIVDEDEQEWLHDFTFKRIVLTDGYMDDTRLDLEYEFVIEIEED
jgi:hypothetical protein